MKFRKVPFPDGHYLYFLSKADYQFNKFAGLICGIWGAIAYLSKNYNFYFFLLHFSCINLSYWWYAPDRQRKSTIVVNFIAGMAAFFLISGVWIGLISSKYHKLTVSSAGAYNISILRSGTPSHPMQTDGFLAPANATAVSVFEDPTYIKLKVWNPFQSSEDIKIYLKLVLSNISKYLSGLAMNYIFDLTVMFFMYLLIFKREQLDRKIYCLIATVLIYPLGYFAVFYEGKRYVLINVMLLYLLSAYMLNVVFKRYRKHSVFLSCISLVLCISLVALTANRVFRDYKIDVSELDSVYHMSTEISKSIEIKGRNIASQNGSWVRAHDMAYFLGARYFGRAKADISDQELRGELLERHIDYYMVYGELSNNIDILKPLKHFDLEPEGLTIYQVQAATI